MKKLLGLLSSLAVLTSTSSVAVACGSSDSRISTPSLNEEKAKEIIASLGGGDFGFQYSDLFSDVDLTTSVVNIINKLVSVNYNYERTNANLNALGLTPFDKANFYNDQFSGLIQTTAENKLFSEFSKSVAKGITEGTSLDFSMGSEFYGLNPVDEVTEAKDADGKTIYIKKGTPIQFGEKTWIIRGEKDADGNTSKETTVPLVKDLTAADSSFKVKAYSDKEMTTEVSDGATISAKTALSLRFQDYFKNKIMIDVMTNALTMVYNQSTLWRNLGSKGETNPYIDVTNPVFSKTQSWGDTLSTNVKMVWVYTLKRDEKANATTVTTEVKEKLKDKLDVNGNLVGDAKTTTGISSIFDALKDIEANGNDEDGNDSYFGFSGYKGIVVSKDGTTIGDNPISGAAYETAVNNSDNLQDTGGIALNGTQNWVFQNASNKNNYDVVITLPIYMMQLLGVDAALDAAKNQITEEGDDDTTPTPNIYKVTGSDGNSKDIQFRRSPDGDAFSNKWAGFRSQLDSPDVNTIASHEDMQTSMFQEIEYLISQDSTNQDTAKRVIYSKYLDVDLIYYAGLYDQIGTYITANKDEDE